MSTMIMDMSSYAVEADCAQGVEYAEEILNAGWNPALSLQHCWAAEHHAKYSKPVIADIPAFLRKMYANQR